jgi:hypothetical protein
MYDNNMQHIWDYYVVVSKNSLMGSAGRNVSDINNLGVCTCFTLSAAALEIYASVENKYNCKKLGASYSCSSNAVSDDTKILSCDRFKKNIQPFFRSFFVECAFSNGSTKSNCSEDLGIAGRIKFKSPPPRNRIVVWLTLLKTMRKLSVQVRSNISSTEYLIYFPCGQDYFESVVM